MTPPHRLPRPARLVRRGRRPHADGWPGRRARAGCVRAGRARRRAGRHGRRGPRPDRELGRGVGLRHAGRARQRQAAGDHRRGRHRRALRPARPAGRHAGRRATRRDPPARAGAGAPLARRQPARRVRHPGDVDRRGRCRAGGGACRRSTRRCRSASRRRSTASTCWPTTSRTPTTPPRGSCSCACRARSPRPSGADKTTLSLYMRQDEPGALLAILTEFAVRGVNMTRIESRPTTQGARRLLLQRRRRGARRGRPGLGGAHGPAPGVPRRALPRLVPAARRQAARPPAGRDRQPTSPTRSSGSTN